jgi:hypothetical protein
VRLYRFDGAAVLLENPMPRENKEENTGDRLTWRQALILLILVPVFIFLSRAIYDYFHANAHLRPIERHAPGSN